MNKKDKGIIIRRRDTAFVQDFSNEVTKCCEINNKTGQALALIRSCTGEFIKVDSLEPLEQNSEAGWVPS